MPEERYHFGEFIVYYEPRRSSGDSSSRGGRQAYFAVARITALEPDSLRADHFYARIADYLEFDRPVPFREGERFFESVLQRDDGQTSKGAFGRAVRALPDDEFDAMLQTGFIATAGPAMEQADAQCDRQEFDEPQAILDRPVIRRIIARPFREQAFARQVRLAYDNRCAVTGLRLINGGGRAEVQAAHIRPVANAGPDSVRNGLALSGTAHWLFDRGLIAIEDDFRILITGQGLPDGAGRLLIPSRQLSSPPDATKQPHRHFLRWHRENVFKG